MFRLQDDDMDGEDFDLAKMANDGEGAEDDGVKVHEIKFDEFGIMDDGVDESTKDQLKRLQGAFKKNYKYLQSRNLWISKPPNRENGHVSFFV